MARCYEAVGSAYGVRGKWFKTILLQARFAGLIEYLCLLCTHEPHKKGITTMATTKSHQNAKDSSMRSNKPAESSKEMKHDVVECVTEYVQHYPGYAALCCVGAGFFLGWKLKPS